MHTFISNTCPAQQAGQAAWNEADDIVTPLARELDLMEARARFLLSLIDYLEHDGGFIKELGSAREALWYLQDQIEELRYALYDVPHYTRTLVYEREMAKIEGATK